MDDTIITIRRVIYTLDSVTVSGKENLMRMLGAINSLDALANRMQAAEQAAEKNDKEAAKNGRQTNK